MSMMFCSPVSSRLSSAISRRAVRELSPPLPWKPMSICCTEVTLGVSAVSIGQGRCQLRPGRSEAHTSALQSLMRITYAVFCSEKNKDEHHLPQARTIHRRRYGDHPIYKNYKR